MAETPTSSSFLTLLNESLSFAPDRADLWMTRFDILRTLGYKREFAAFIDEAKSIDKIRRELDWKSLRRMWEQIAPNEVFPGDAEEKLQRAQARPGEDPSPDLALGDQPRAESARRERVQRFNDVAMKVASTELGALTKAWTTIAAKPSLLEDFARKTRALLQRPTKLEFSPSLSQAAGAERRIFLKREDLRGVPVEAEHAAAQCYVASLLGKNGIVTANDVDLHALETATAASFFNLKCTIVVRAEDVKARASLVADLEMLGAQVKPMPKAGMLSADPREGAVRLWQKATATHHLVMSLGMAPAPYTAMANAFQGLLGREAETQYADAAAMLKRPRTLVAAVGSEADAIGFAMPFFARKDIRIAYAEPEPGGVRSWRPSRRLKPYNGQIREHSWLRGVGRIQHVAVSDGEAAVAREQLARDGIKASLEDARGVALALILSRGDPTPRDFIVLVA